jgi:hypothetical protein
MRTETKSLLAVVLAIAVVGTACNKEKQPAEQGKASQEPPRSELATPEAGLRAFLDVRKRGDNEAYRKVVSKQVLKATEATAKATGEAWKIDPEDFFSRLTVLGVRTVQANAGIAIIHAKVVYNAKWLDAHNKEEAQIAKEASQDGSTLVFTLLPGLGEMQWEEPIAVSGEGFAAFAMIHEEDGWRFHLGYMTDKQANLKKVSDAFEKGDALLEH